MVFVFLQQRSGLTIQVLATDLLVVLDVIEVLARSPEVVVPPIDAAPIDRSTDRPRHRTTLRPAARSRIAR